MRSLFIMLICSLSMFAETYISGSVITNSVISGVNIKKGSGLLVDKKIIPTKPFNSVTLDTVGDVTITHSPQNSITIRTDDNLIDNILLHVKDRTLFIEVKGSINPTKGLKISINSKFLNKLKVNGASDIIVKDYQLDSFSCEIDGTSNIDMLDSVVKDADITVDGSADIRINVSRKMRLSVDGTAEIKYRGNPKIEKDIDGVADIIHIK